ncbi:hypothetical protein MTO96_034419 [Rhipicephalus appendiculatus]
MAKLSSFRSIALVAALALVLTTMQDENTYCASAQHIIGVKPKFRTKPPRWPYAPGGNRRPGPLAFPPRQRG